MAGITMAAFIKLGLALPETQLRISGSYRSLRVRDRAFCYLSDDDSAVTVKALRGEQAAVVAADPQTFAPAWASGRFAWIRISLARVDRTELSELLDEAWHLSAPKRLAATRP